MTIHLGCSQPITQIYSFGNDFSAAAMMAAKTASSWAIEVNPASYAEGAK
jgi:hypothetical protein